MTPKTMVRASAVYSLLGWLFNMNPGRSAADWIGVKIERAFAGGDSHFRTNNGLKIQSVQMRFGGGNQTRNGCVPVFLSVESTEFEVYA